MWCLSLRNDECLNDVINVISDCFTDIFPSHALTTLLAWNRTHLAGCQMSLKIFQAAFPTATEFFIGADDSESLYLG